MVRASGVLKRRKLRDVGIVAGLLTALVVSPNSATGLVSTSATTTKTASSAAEPGLDCPENLVETELANGASWRMCARIHPMRGLVLERVEFKPPTSREYTGYKRVLDQLWLAQLNVPYDNGLVQYDDITSFGFGGDHLLAQTDVTCPGDVLEVTQTKLVRDELVTRDVPGICVQEVPTGLATHSLESIGSRELRVTGQGSALEISSLSKISWYEYQQNIKLDDHGEIDVGLGATGDVAPGGLGGAMFGTDPAYGWQLGGETTEHGEHTHATSHWHNAIWRVDFGIDEGARQEVEQWDYANTAEPGAIPRLAGTGKRQKQAFHAVPDKTMDDTTWFRVVNPDSLNADGHPRSYEIVNRNLPHEEIEVFAPLMSFTNDHECQEYASMNLHVGCPGESVLDYVADEVDQVNDPVAWVNVGFHHIDRDEDQSPMHMHWQRFQLIPRDFFAQKPGITDERSCINGAGWIDSLDSPCVATNLSPPTVRVDGDLGVDTTLYASPGTWNERRAAWDYTYLWLRDGEPIVDGAGEPALLDRYTVAAADQGAQIGVRVTASHPGFPSGYADSEPVLVPGLPTTRPVTPPGSSATKTKIKKLKIKRTTRGKKNGRAKLKVGVFADGAVTDAVSVVEGTVKVVVKRGKKKTYKKVLRLRNGAARVKLEKLRKGRYKVVAVYRGAASSERSKALTRFRVR